MSMMRCAFSRLNVYTTSAGVSGSPLVNLTPLRMVNVSVLLPLLHAQLVANQGLTLAFCSVLTNTSGSYTVPSDKLMLNGLNGLKLQVHVPPVSLSMVSTPRGPEEAMLDVPLPLQAAASSAATANSPVIGRRLMPVVLH